MLNSWRRWCRLCAKENGAEIDVFMKNELVADLAQAIQKYFLITITPFDLTPTLICTSCYKFIINLIQFAEHTYKVETIFSKLIFNEFNMVAIDLNNLKFQHGLSEFVWSISNLNDKCDQETDTNDLSNESGTGNPDIFLETKSCDSNEEMSPDRIKRGQKRKTKVFSTIVKDEIEENKILLQHKLSCDTNIEIPENLQEETRNENIDCLNEDYVNIKNEEFDTEDESIDLKSIKKRRKGIRKNLNETFNCNRCEKSFKRETSLQQHFNRYHESEEMKLYSCLKCDKEFPTEKRLQQHETVHLPRELKFRHSCLYCDRKFSKSTNVQAHIKAIHIGDKPFICEECGKTFRTNGALKEHKYIHMDETPYECSKCPKKFKNLARLKTHEDTHNDTVYVCPNCGLKLNTKRTLQSHMVVHSDQKKYKCNYCGNEYKRAKALKNHLIIHTGLRPYTCPFCDKTFANGSNCRSHKKKAHPAELAAMEAAGEMQPATNIPKLSQLKAVPTKSELTFSSEHILDSDSPNLSISAHLMNQPLTSTIINQIIPSHLEISQQLQTINPLKNQQEFHDHTLFEQIQVSLNT